MLNALHAAEFTLAKSSIFLGKARGGLYPEIMPVSLADESRRNADECRQQAEIAGCPRTGSPQLMSSDPGNPRLATTEAFRGALFDFGAARYRAPPEYAATSVSHWG